MRAGEAPGPFRYLNTCNPDIKAALCTHAAKIAMGRSGTTREDWDRLERELMRRYLLSDYTPAYRYPFFLQVNLPAVRPLWEEYLRAVGCPVGAAPSDRTRRQFERQVAVMVAGGGVG